MSASTALFGLAASIPAFYHFLAPKSTLISGLVLPAGYGYVTSSVVAAIWLTFLMGFKVSTARKAAQIPYPYAYAERAVAEKDRNAHLFNCAQRAHLNTLENLPGFAFLSLFAGLFYPRLTGAFSAAWVVSRVIYAVGYYSGTPSKRGYGGLISGLSYIGLLGVATYGCFLAKF